MAGPLILYQFDAATVNLVLEGLSELPYKRVARTIELITAQAEAALNPPPRAPEPGPTPAPTPAPPAKRKRKPPNEHPQAPKPPGQG